MCLVRQRSAMDEESPPLQEDASECQRIGGNNEKRARGRVLQRSVDGFRRSGHWLKRYEPRVWILLTILMAHDMSVGKMVSEDND
ncbi:unnamed protein product [Heligmosomoides polygyrus]|uniref:Uncharacterized protein n=1 Tax=Heligmosomoides polygyrus TaxID=6339 RepID=A0A183FPK3_HELPZ|nr:unnamed protein product [Heligmosomoides polygyrus]